MQFKKLIFQVTNFNQNRHLYEMGREEFENTVFILKDRLFRFARRILNDVQDAEDAKQMTNSIKTDDFGDMEE
jgi:hypothetical protein